MRAEFPDKLGFLFEPKRYKVLYGGRGGAKSWGAARALLILGAQKKLRILCAREFQNSIAESVHFLLESQIEAMGLRSEYEVQESSIFGKNGTEFTFAGLKKNINNLKSFEGCDICWVEEAQNVSKASWDKLTPTIRKENSEIWITFNPELAEDETYKRFVERPPSDSIVVKIGWEDNPWFSAVLRKEKDDKLRDDPDGFDNIWGGNCRKAVEGAIYAKEIAKVEADKRFCRVPYDAEKPVHTFWDLGWADNTSIWFYQRVGLEHRLIDYEQYSQTKLSDIVNHIQSKGYAFGTDVLPHDAKQKLLAADGKTIKSQLEGMGRRVEIAPDLTVYDGINAGRSIFGSCWFDTEKCADGIQCLRHYRYEYDDDKKTLKGQPLHDWASHGADAFRYFAVGHNLTEGWSSSSSAPARAPMGTIC